MFFKITLLVLISIFIDLLLSEVPLKIHPVVFFGILTDKIKPRLLKIKNIFSGLILTMILIFILLIIFITLEIMVSLSNNNFLADLFSIVVLIIFLKSSFSINLLLSSATEVKDQMEDDIDSAKKSLSFLVSRNTEELTKDKMISATIETLTENITDSVTAPIFYYYLSIIMILGLNILIKFEINTLEIVVIGTFIAFSYRIINTLDAMVGYKNKENFLIGYFPAKLDDIFNFIPARISGYFIVIASFFIENYYSYKGDLKSNVYNWRNSYKILKRDAKNCPSPNSGYTMAATAGSLGIKLEKNGVYELGDNLNLKTTESIEKAVNLSKLTIFFLLSFLIILSTFIIYFMI